MARRAERTVSVTPVPTPRGSGAVTARLSQRFYEKFGDDIAKELVDWFNDVDATYRADLREMNELNFARFDVKVEQRFAEFDVKLGTLKSELIKWMFLFWTGSALANLLLRR